MFRAILNILEMIWLEILLEMCVGNGCHIPKFIWHSCAVRKDFRRVCLSHIVPVRLIYDATKIIAAVKIPPNAFIDRHKSSL